MSEPACGHEIEIVNPLNFTAARIVKFCHGWRIISWREYLPKGGQALPNGLYMSDWKGVIQQLVKVAAITQDTRGWQARGTGADGLYRPVSLDREIRASDLAELVHVPPAEVFTELHDYLIIPVAEGDHVGE